MRLVCTKWASNGEQMYVILTLLSLYTGWVEHGSLIDRTGWTEASGELEGESERGLRKTSQPDPGGSSEGSNREEGREETEDDRHSTGQGNPGSEGGHSEGLGETTTGTMADRVAYCESGQKNVKNPSSSASGYFQFIDSTWTWVTKLDPPAMGHSYEVQLEAFHTLWDEGRGASHWEPSRYCWQHENPWNHYSR